MKIIGLTGGIGSGKTTVLALFEALGALTYVADVEAKKIMNADAALKKQLIDLFGKQAYENGKLNSGYIASIVFNNKEKLNELNALVHPKVREDFQYFIKTHKADFVIYEAAILFESGSDQFCDYIITVIADIDHKIERIIKRDGVTEVQILERMKNQSADDFKIQKSDFVIRNNKLAATKQQVLTIFELLKKLKDK